MKSFHFSKCFSMLVIGFVIGSVLIAGCDDNDNGDDPGPAPATNISGRWEGIDDASDLNFTFFQDGSRLTGYSSFLGRFEGIFTGRTLKIESTDIVAYLSDDNETFRGTYTNTSGQFVNFTLEKVE